MNIAEQDKQLLLKDLCARLSYHCRVFYEYVDDLDNKTYGYSLTLNTWCINEFVANKAIVKPYLQHFNKLTWNDIEAITKITDCDRVGAKMIVYELQANGTTDFELSYAKIQQLTDYLLSRHFDVHGLIKKGLALEAPTGMYDL